MSRAASSSFATMMPYPVVVLRILDAEDTPEAPDTFAFRPTRDHHTRALRLRTSIDVLRMRGITWRDLAFVLHGPVVERLEDALEGTPVGRALPADTAAAICLVSQARVADA